MPTHRNRQGIGARGRLTDDSSRDRRTGSTLVDRRSETGAQMTAHGAGARGRRSKSTRGSRESKPKNRK